MLRYQLAGDVTISLNSNDPNKSANIQIEGDEKVVALVRDRLLRSYGAFGHMIRETTTPIDLNAALKSDDFKEFRPQIVEGAELVGVYDPRIPPGAIT
jgi:hypothetical protein